ncbi:MAG: gamma-glutamyl-gamma-aminobutyrate hydrolase family protein [Planctomycetota bacterium]
MAIIGLTCEYDLKKNLREATSLYPDYFEAVEQAGGVPLLIPPIRSSAAMRRALERLDGVILTGGDDYSPRHYGEEPHATWTPMMPRREQFDLQFASCLLNTGIPTLAICGGVQLINISLGGSLIQDIPSELPSGCKHSARAPELAINEVTIEPGTLLGGTGTEPRKVKVRCYHHQSIGRLAPGLRATGRTSDGVIEVVEGETPGRFLLGVQWHPEKHLPESGPDRDFHLEVFRLLVHHAGSFRDGWNDSTIA